MICCYQVMHGTNSLGTVHHLSVFCYGCVWIKVTLVTGACGLKSPLCYGRSDKLNTNIKRSLVDGLLEIRNGSIVIVLFSCRCISKTLRVQKTTIYTCVVSVSFVPWKCKITIVMFQQSVRIFCLEFVRNRVFRFSGNFTEVRELVQFSMARTSANFR